jgi:DNA-binding transcriptional LysR family regulator
MRTEALELSIQLRQLAYLIEVAAGPNWTDAADRLGISQPALSQSMHELERRMGTQLFEALGRRRVLTSEGWQVVGFARSVISATEDLQSDLRSSGPNLHGRLRVGMIDAASLYVLPGSIRQFRRTYPDVELDLTVAPSTPLLNGLRELEYDVVFVTGPVDSPDLESIVIHEEPLFLYGSIAGDPATGDWVMYPGTSRTRRVIDRYFVDSGWTPRIILESSNPAVLSQMVGMGFGWSILPAAVVDGSIGSLDKYRPDPVAVRSLCAVWRRSADGNPRMLAFRDLATTAVSVIS